MTSNRPNRHRLRKTVALVGLLATCGGLVVVTLGWVRDRPAAEAGAVPVAARPAEPSRPRVEAPPLTSPARVQVDVVGSRPAKIDDLEARSTIAPTTVTLDGIGVAAGIVPVGVVGDTGEMDVVADAGVVSWYRYGVSPGEPGVAVLAGHVDYGGARGVFIDLANVAVGAPVVVGYADGSRRTFVVTARRRFLKSELPTEELFAESGPSVLALVTCGGEFDDDSRSYRENVVVYAAPA